MNTEERQLAEMLHRVTPEPPRRMTVEDIAHRVASEGRGREPRSRRGFSFASGAFRGNPLRPPAFRGRRWAPALAALGVIVIAGGTAAVASVATSHHGQAPAASGTPTSSASVSTPSSSPSGPASSAPPGPLRLADGMWGAVLLDDQSYDQESLTGGGGALFAFGNGTLNRIDPATGIVTCSTPYHAPVPGRPVVVGNTVWVVWSYGSGDIFLHGYDTSTLDQVASVEVPAIGGTVSSAQGVLAAAPDGRLYVAAGREIAVVDSATRQLTNGIFMSAGQASSIAVAPDGRHLYVGFGSADSFNLAIYDAGTGRLLSLSRMQGGDGGNLVATAGGVWGTAGTGMSEWVWFAPGGDLTRSSRVTQGAGAGLASLPSVSGGAVWIGGSHELICASPATGKALARTTIPTDHSVVEYFGSVTVLNNGHAYALYQDEHAQLSGIAQLTPPAACSGG